MDTPLSQYAKIQPMVQQDARDIATQVYTELGTQYGVPSVPAHVHDGTDTLQIPFANLADADSYIALKSTVLTPAQVKLLNTTPITLVPAIGPRAIIIVESVDVRLVFGSAAYTGTNALEFRYTDGSGAKVTADVSTTFLNSAASAYSHVAGVTTELVPVANAPIVVRVPTANPGAGDSQITVIVKYRVVAYQS